MDCSPPGSSNHGIFQARGLEWGAIAFSRLQFIVYHKVVRSCPLTLICVNYAHLVRHKALSDHQEGLTFLYYFPISTSNSKNTVPNTEWVYYTYMTNWLIEWLNCLLNGTISKKLSNMKSLRPIYLNKLHNNVFSLVDLALFVFKWLPICDYINLKREETRGTERQTIWISLL